MSADLVIRNAKLAASAGNDGAELGDILIENGLISRIAKAGTKSTAAVDSSAVSELDAGGRPVIPGMIDPHVHLRCPGMEEKEDWTSGGRAALAGGVTTVIDMPNTRPATETPEALDLKRAAVESAARAAESAGRCLPRRLFWVGASPDSLPLLPELLAQPDVAGVKLFFSETSANSSSSDIGFITEAFRAAAEAGKPAAVHSELGAMLQPVAAVDGLTELAAHNLRRPEAAAVAGTALALELAAVTDCRLYLCHLSTGAEFEMVRRHKQAYGADSVIAELTPHHLLLDEEHQVAGGPAAWAKVNPPLRSTADREAAVAALLDGTVDCIGSDHAPHRPEEKACPDFHSCPSGFPGLETELGLVAGVLQGKQDRLAEVTSRRASEVFGLGRLGAVEAGRAADLVILGGAAEVAVSEFKTKAKYSPFNGMEMSVSVYKTIIGGREIEQ